MIKISNLNKSFDSQHVLKNVSLHINKGEIFGLIGKSGAGKSTLLRCINLLEDYDSGSIHIDGLELKGKTANVIRNYRKDIGMIFQHFSLLERQNVYTNIAIPMQCWGYKKDEIDMKVKELAKIVEIEDKLFRKPNELSGGQRQRVAIARALSLSPKIMLCDEATSALDPKTTKSILSLLREINEKLNITIVLVTHEMNVICEICHKVAIIENGSISSTGDVEQIFLNQPPSLKRLIGADSIALPKDGTTLRIMFKSFENTNTLIPDLAIKLSLNFIVLSYKLEKFRDNVICTTIINIANHNLSHFTNYLDSSNIFWEVIEYGQL